MNLRKIKMKYSLLALALFTFFTSCNKDPEHSIRIKNNSSGMITDAKIRDVSYGTIAIGETTDYQLLGEVNNETVSGTYENDFQFLLTVDIDRQGESNWSLTINNIDTATGDLNVMFTEED